MPRKKREYNNKEYYKEMIEDFINNNRPRIINHMMSELGYDDMEKLQEDEFHMRFGLDCGWYYLVPKKSEMKREWRLDGFEKLRFPTAYPTQSLTVQEPQITLIAEELHLNDEFNIEEYLD